MPPSFHELLADLDYPMVVVTAAAGEPSGCLVGFSTQCSIHPPRFLVCISKKNHTFPVASAAEHLAVHVLTPEDRDIAELFGHETGDRVDKFARCNWHPGPGGVPVLDDVPRRFVGRVLARHDVGDHVAFVLEPVVTEGEPRPGQLGFQSAKEIEPGHEP